MLLDGPVLEVADDEDQPTPALRVAALAPSRSNLGPLLHVARGALSGDHDAESWNNKLCFFFFNITANQGAIFLKVKRR